MFSHSLSFRLFRVFTAEAPSRAEPQPKLGISRAKAQRPQRKRNNIYPNLAFFAPWREEYLESEVFHLSENLQSSQSSEYFLIKNAFSAPFAPPRCNLRVLTLNK